MAATLHLPYVLIDAEWDEMKDGKTIEDAVAYARQQGVRPLIWYNSSVGWIDGAPTPKFRLNKAEDREREFAWCEKIGVRAFTVRSGTTTCLHSPVRQHAITPHCPSPAMSSDQWTTRHAPSATHNTRTSRVMLTN